MHLIDVTNTYSDLVQNQLNSTSAQYIKVYSLGNSSVVYTETDCCIHNNPPDFMYTKKRPNFRPLLII